MLILFQLLFLLFSCGAIANVFGRFRAKQLGPKGFLFWLLFWLAADIVVIWPNSSTMIAKQFGIGRGTDFVLYVGVSLLFYLLFRMHVKIESLSRDLTKIVRRDAIEQVSHPDKQEKR